MSATSLPFGAWLRQLRTERDLTQETLAELANCSVQAIRFFESGKRRPSLMMAEHLAEVLAIPAAEWETFVATARQPLATTDAAPSESEPASQAMPTVGTVPHPETPLHSTLPPLDQPLIGREGERNVLCQLLLKEQRRLVTVVGAGGVGKTHLVLDVATAMADQFADGVVFVPLAPLRAAAHLPSAVATALPLSLGSDDPGEQVLTALATRQLLLILDSFEELLHQEEDAAVTWVNQLLQRAAQVQVLVTSRERLRLSNERTFELSGLALPTATVRPEQSDAVLLFLERAQQVVPTFALNASNKAAVAQICQLVDGSPLGIELAAAWVRMLTPAEIAEEIAGNVDFLARANRDTAPRHRSMRAVFDHSWTLLDDAEQRVLGRLAVFRGGCNREAAQAVTGTTLPLLAGLIDKSLVRRRQATTQTTAAARYELHEVVRQFAAEKRRAEQSLTANAVTPTNGLEQDDAWFAHYTYFYQLAARAKQNLHSSEQLQWLQVLDEEYANLRAALDRCLRTADFDCGLQLALQLEEYWYIRGYHGEGLQRLLAFLQTKTAPVSEVDIANGYAAAAILAIAGGNYTMASAYLNQAIDTLRQQGDQASLARALRYYGLIALHEADYGAAERYAAEAVDLASAVHNAYEAATSLSHLAEIALIQQEYGRAQEMGERAVAMLRTIADKNQLAGSLRRLAQAELYQRQFAAARRNALESLLLNNEVGDQRGIAASTVMLAAILAADGAWPAVAELLGAAATLLAQAQATLLPADQLVYDETWERMTTALPAFQGHFDAGHQALANVRTPPYELGWIQGLVEG